MRRSGRGVVAAILVVALSPPASAAVSPVDLAERARRAADLAREAVGAPSPERMDRVRQVLGLPAEVSFGRATVAMPADPLLAGLEGEGASDFDVAARHLEALAGVLETAATQPSTDEAGLREALAEASEGLQVEESFSDRLWRSLATFLAELFRRGEGRLGPGIGWLLIAGMLAAAVFLARRLGIRTVPEAAAHAEPSLPSVADWRRRAEEARARGDLAEAVACLYRALVAGLAREGLIEDRPSLTAGEVRRAAGRLRPELTDATARYERVRYGRSPATERDVAMLLEAGRRARAA